MEREGRGKSRGFVRECVETNSEMISHSEEGKMGEKDMREKQDR